MNGKLFFIGIATFALGILYGIGNSVNVPLCIGSVMFGVLSLVLYAVVSHQSIKIFLSLVAVFFLLFPLGAVRSAIVPKTLPAAYAPLINKPISLIGKIVADPDIRQKNQQLVVFVDRNNVPTKMLVFAPLFQHFAYGEKVLIAGTLMLPTPFATDGGRTFRYDQFLEKKGVYSMVPQADLLEIAPPEGVVSEGANILFEVKHTFVEGLSRALPDPFAQLAAGLLTGDQHGLGDSLVTMLALSGLIWVVVLSGYHVTLIADGVLKAVSFLPRRFALCIAGVSILAIVFATGGSAPSLRGGIMACFTLFARATGRNYDALRALGAATVLILLWNPLLLAYDSGFQLSLAVTPALILGVPVLEARILWIKSTFVREIVAVSIVAQLACLPLILWQTGQVGVWAIPANLFVMSFVPISMFFSFTAGFVGMVFPLLAPLAGLPAYAVLYYILAVAKFAAALPFANIVLPPFSFTGVLIMYSIFILLTYWFWRMNRAAALRIVKRLRLESVSR